MRRISTKIGVWKLPLKSREYEVLSHSFRVIYNNELLALCMSVCHTQHTSRRQTVANSNHHGSLLRACISAMPLRLFGVVWPDTRRNVGIMHWRASWNIALEGKLEYCTGGQAGILHRRASSTTDSSV